MSSTDEVAIKVTNVSKTFKLPHEKHTSIKGALIGLFKSNRSYEKHRVLKDISFEIKKGEFFGIVGRNGSGKSTLLKLLAGIYTPDKGHIQVNGKLTPFIELGVGFNPELTGRENVFLNGALLGFNRQEMEEMYEEIVEFAELEQFMDQKLKNYSSGMQVRLAFSIAIRADTPILLLDEVLAVGDESFQQNCLDEFRNFKRQDKTIVLVTHSMDYIEKFCDKAMVIEEGEIRDLGKPDEIAFLYKKLNIEGSTKNLSKHQINDKETGNKKVVITQFKTTLKDDTLQTNGKLEFIIDYKQNDKSVLAINAALGIYHVDGPYIVGVDTVTDRVKDIKIKESGKISLTFNNLNLLGGQYFVNVALFEEDRENPMHYVKDIVRFNIIDIQNRRGLTHIDHKWSYK